MRDYEKAYRDRMLRQLRKLKFPSEVTIAKLVKDVKKYVTPSCDPSDVNIEGSNSVWWLDGLPENDYEMGGISLCVMCDGTRGFDNSANWGFQHSAPYKGKALAEHDWTAKEGFFRHFKENVYEIEERYDVRYGWYVFVVRQDSDPKLSAREIVRNLKPYQLLED